MYNLLYRLFYIVSEFSCDGASFVSGGVGVCICCFFFVSFIYFCSLFFFDEHHSQYIVIVTEVEAGQLKNKAQAHLYHMTLLLLQY